MRILFSSDLIKNKTSMNQYIDTIINDNSDKVYVSMLDFNEFSAQAMIDLFFFSFEIFKRSNKKIHFIDTSDLFSTILSKFNCIPQFIIKDTTHILTSSSEFSRLFFPASFPYIYTSHVSNILEHSNHYFEIENLFNMWYPLNPKLLYGLKSIIKELTANAGEHSVGAYDELSSFKGSYIDFVWKEEINSSKEVIHYQIYDSGIGIRNNIEKIYGYLSSEDFIYIAHAVKPGVTSRADKEGGIGLPNIIKEIKSLHASISIHSGCGIYSITESGMEKLYNSKDLVFGTVIAIDIIIVENDLV